MFPLSWGLCFILSSDEDTKFLGAEATGAEGHSWYYPDLDELIQSRMRSRKGRKIRPRSKILIAILEACRTPSVEHWIMIKARLGYETFWTHMNRLLDEGKMICSFVGDQRYGGGKSKAYYSITKDGLSMLDELRHDEE
jgi:predicted transcriptional regulator